MKKTPKNTFKPNNKALLSYLIIIGLTPITVNADSRFTSDASVYRDSDDVMIQDISMEYQRRLQNGVNWKLKAHDYHFNGKTNNGIYSDKYFGNEIIGSIEKEFNNRITAGVSVGAISLKNGQTHQKTTFTPYKVKVTAKPSNNLAFTMEHGEDLLFDESIIEDLSNELISGKTTKLSGDWRVSNRVKVEGSSQYRKLSDDNRSKHHKAAVLYGISPNTPWVWAGIETEYLSYDNDDTNYWSPKKFKSHALVLRSSVDVNKKLSLDMSGSLSRTKENNNDWGDGGSISVGTNYKVGRNSSVRAHASYFESSHEESNWNGNNVGLSFTSTGF